MSLKIKDKTACRWDLVSLGEVMLRLDPGDGRVATTRTFQAWEGGGEYNVARGLRRCFGLRHGHRHRAGRQSRRPSRRGPDAARAASISRTLRWVQVRRRRPQRAQRPELHRARLRRARRAGLLRSRPHRRVAAEARRRRLGRRSSARRARAGSTPAASSPPSPTPRPTWPGGDGGGAASTARSSRTISTTAPSLWKAHRRAEKARASEPRAGGSVDVMLGNEEDFTAALGFEVEGIDEHLPALDPAELPEDDRARGARTYPELRASSATTLRNAQDGDASTTGARSATHDGTLHEAPARARTWRSSTAWAAATRSPPASIYGFLTGKGAAVGGRVRRRARRAGHDHPRRHHHGHARRSDARDEGRRRPGGALDLAMTKQEILRKIADLGLVPVVRAQTRGRGA